MKKRIFFGSAAIVVLLISFVAWKLFSSSVHVPETKYFYIHTGESYDSVKANLHELKIIQDPTWFHLAAKLVGYKKMKPGRYEIKQGMSLVDLVRYLNNAQQTPVSFVITKIRTREILASKIAHTFECDSLQVIQFLNSPDSLKPYDLDTNTVLVAAMPYTYTIKWNTTPRKIFDELYRAYKTFWTDERKQMADSIHLTPLQVSILASIIDEETNSKSDRPNIASVYLNRIRIGMPLQADPTVKYAMKDFGLRRILNTHLQTISPYNTYLNTGLPPGPICTPQVETIKAVLSAPKTDYLYFVANSTFNGTHIFTTNLRDHLKYARIYQKELNKRNVK